MLWIQNKIILLFLFSELIEDVWNQFRWYSIWINYFYSTLTIRHDLNFFILRVTTHFNQLLNTHVYGIGLSLKYDGVYAETCPNQFLTVISICSRSTARLNFEIIRVPYRGTLESTEPVHMQITSMKQQFIRYHKDVFRKPNSWSTLQNRRNCFTYDEYLNKAVGYTIVEGAGSTSASNHAFQSTWN